MEQTKHRSPEMNPEQAKNGELSAKDLEKVAGGSPESYTGQIELDSFSFGASNAADVTPKKG